MVVDCEREINGKRSAQFALVMEECWKCVCGEIFFVCFYRGEVGVVGVGFCRYLYYSPVRL